jgi:hypothetical protein
MAGSFGSPLFDPSHSCAYIVGFHVRILLDARHRQARRSQTQSFRRPLISNGGPLIGSATEGPAKGLARF